MPPKMNLKRVKDRLKNETLDLSLCDLKDVPVREIAAVRKANHLDLSSNLLTSLPSTFVTLKHIVRLDLSRNSLIEIPENIGEMRQLEFLDLYANQISRLPLSLGDLENLRWLDLKENPLTPAVASVAGPCSNLSECQACAKSIVAYLSNVKQSIEEEKIRRLNATVNNAEANNLPAKDEGKKKKKKTNDKEHKKTINKSGASKLVAEKMANAIEYTVPQISNNNNNNTSKKTNEKDKASRGILRKTISTLVWSVFICLVILCLFVVLPQNFKETSSYIETRTGIPIKAFHEQSRDVLAYSVQAVTTWGKSICNTLNEAYVKRFA